MLTKYVYKIVNMVNIYTTTMIGCFYSECLCYFQNNIMRKVPNEDNNRWTAHLGIIFEICISEIPVA